MSEDPARLTKLVSHGFKRRAPSGWQPIDTLPSEGGPFLIYWPETIVERGHEIDLCSADEYESILGFGERPATHWMPLPAPPEPR